MKDNVSNSESQEFQFSPEIIRKKLEIQLAMFYAMASTLQNTKNEYRAAMTKCKEHNLLKYIFGGYWSVFQINKKSLEILQAFYNELMLEIGNIARELAK